jgi:hypothetical protein
MSHTRDHIIINRIRNFIAAWPLSSVGGTGLLGAILGALF